jgi:DegV family protein with EDD domain
MNTYRIITDSCADLSPQLVSELDVTVLPLTVHLNGKSYHNMPDESELTARDFYQQVRDGAMPTTSQVNVEAFTTAIEPLLQAEQDVLYIGFSSGLSGTYNSGRLAAQELADHYPNRKIIAVDTLAASMGEGLLVYHACKLRDAGKTIDEVAAWLEENKLHMAHWFTVDDLYHLKRGGRVSGAAAFFGTMLNIKPVLHVDDAGHLIPMEKVRGRKTSLDALVDHMKQTAINPGEQVIFISHGDCLTDAQYVAELVRTCFGTKKVYLNNVGPVIGAHSGPGTMALFFLATNRS